MTPETQKQLKITDVSAKKLDKLNLHTAWDLVLHLPLRYEDETHIMPIKDAPIGVPCQVEGEVIHQEVTFKPRKQLIESLLYFIRKQKGRLNVMFQTAFKAEYLKQINI